ncbi:death domain-associated protein 6-like [Puntigrus tetrazona]|uniref:death domain-associated protein 6-like n=1 Tax=Puntigrus tetrazona TaxID=1606681 RepID=UPI001C89786B|nr:death domain-associated protein 6-like [Puntigrus tetrazona]
MDSIVISDDDDEEASTSASGVSVPTPRTASRKPREESAAAPTHITRSLRYASAKKDVHVLQFVEHCSKHSQDHPEVVTYLQSRYSKALPTFLTSVEFRNTLGRCLTRSPGQHRQNLLSTSMNSAPFSNSTRLEEELHTARASQTKPEQKSNGTNIQEQERLKEEEEKREDEEKRRKPKGLLEETDSIPGKPVEGVQREIRRLQERELSADDLEKEDSSYIQEHKLKRKMMKIYDKLCELKGCNTLTGRVIEQKIPYNDKPSSYDIKIERYINSPEALHNPPDYTDILKVVQRTNERYKLILTRKQTTQIAQEAFRETGNKLQERRHLDMVYNFGSHLTDSFKPSNSIRLRSISDTEPLDPALTDPTLNRKLRSNRDVALSSLEEVITKYAIKQEDIEVLEEMRKRQERDRQKKDDDEEDVEEEPLNNSDNDQPMDENSPPSIKSSAQDTEEDQGDEDQRSPASSTHETETNTNHVAVEQSPPFIQTSDLMPIGWRSSASSDHSKSDTAETVSTNQDAPSATMRSANCSPLPQTSPLLIDEMGNYKKRKRSSAEHRTTASNGDCTQDSDIPLDMGVIFCPEEDDVPRTMTSSQLMVRSSRSTPPPKRNKVNVATQCDRRK